MSPSFSDSILWFHSIGSSRYVRFFSSEMALRVELRVSGSMILRRKKV